MTPALLLCLALGADEAPPAGGHSALWPPTPPFFANLDVASADERRNWMLGGAAAWAPIGASAGALAALTVGALDSREALRLGVGTAVGALVGIGLGAALGWSASQGSDGSRLAVLIPAALELLGVLIGLGFVVYMGRDAR